MGGKAKFNTSIKESMAQQLFSSTESGISDDSLSLTVSGYIQMYIYGHFNSVVLSKMRDCTYSNHCHMCFGDYQLQKLHLVSHLNHYFYIWLCVLLKKKKMQEQSRKNEKGGHLIAQKNLPSEHIHWVSKGDLNMLILKSLLWRPTVVPAEHCIDCSEIHEANLYLIH